MHNMKMHLMHLPLSRAAAFKSSWLMFLPYAQQPGQLMHEAGRIFRCKGATGAQLLRWTIKPKPLEQGPWLATIVIDI